jgi:hypothetical protein
MNLLNQTLTFAGNATATRDDFRPLLQGFYGLFMRLATRELDEVMDRIIVVRVDLLIDYGNGTATWFNGTAVSLDASAASQKNGQNGQKGDHDEQRTGGT